MLLGPAGLNKVPVARLSEGRGESTHRALVMRGERLFTSGLGLVLEPGIWETFTFLGAGIFWS